MPAIRVTITLPYYLRLAEGDYSWSGRDADRVAYWPQSLPRERRPGLPLRASFVNLDTADPNEYRTREGAGASQPLMDKPLVAAVSGGYPACRDYRTHPSPASPFRYEVVGAAVAAEWSTDVEYEPTGPQPVPLTAEQTTNAVRDGLLGGTEPSVADLFLLDAERALHGTFPRDSVVLLEHD